MWIWRWIQRSRRAGSPRLSASAYHNKSQHRHRLSSHIWLSSPSNRVILTEIKSKAVSFISSRRRMARIVFALTFILLLCQQTSFFYVATNEKFSTRFFRDTVNFELDKFARDQTGDMKTKIEIVCEWFESFVLKVRAPATLAKSNSQLWANRSQIHSNGGLGASLHDTLIVRVCQC